MFAIDPHHYPDPLFVLFSGGLMLGAVYMATDMVTSPVTPQGMWLYGALIGVLTVIIRYSGGLPEGVMYAILIGNAATPMIERVTQPVAFGTAVNARRTSHERAGQIAGPTDCHISASLNTGVT